MPRKSHSHRETDESCRPESFHGGITIYLKPEMRKFLEIEAERITTERKKRSTTAAWKVPRVGTHEIIKALITAYYEKRVVAELLVGPDD